MSVLIQSFVVAMHERLVLTVTAVSSAAVAATIVPFSIRARWPRAYCWSFWGTLLSVVAQRFRYPSSYHSSRCGKVFGTSKFSSIGHKEIRPGYFTDLYQLGSYGRDSIVCSHECLTQHNFIHMLKTHLHFIPCCFLQMGRSNGYLQCDMYQGADVSLIYMADKLATVLSGVVFYKCPLNGLSVSVRSDWLYLESEQVSACSEPWLQSLIQSVHAETDSLLVT